MFRLHTACEAGTLHLVSKYLLNGDKVHINEKDDYWGLTPLMYASMWNHSKVCKLLLENGANVNIQGGPTNKSPLMLAACYGHDTIVDILIKSGTMLSKYNYSHFLFINCI